ncbi:MAG: hypothetical protein ABI184_06165 [Ginsengibacter sp.]
MDSNLIFLYPSFIFRMGNKSLKEEALRNYKVPGIVVDDSTPALESLLSRRVSFGMGIFI